MKMINILSYVGMNMQSEICLWCLLGLVRTIFDATLFKVNANLKQVWQMNMPAELSKPVQRALRTMVSGVMLVQCFTVYVYLAAYIVLLYPVFLEERPALVLPWLLLAAVRKLLCELTSLTLGLGTCLLLGPARPPCIKFVVVKFAIIMPAFYMWMLVFSYYHALKVATAFKTFPAVLPPNHHDYGLELAVRRRRTKSLLGEEQLRKKLVANFYEEITPSATDTTHLRPVLQTSSRIVISTDSSIEEEGQEADVMKPSAAGWSDIGVYEYEDWFGSEVMIPRDTDRILEQIVLMLLRISAYLKKEGKESITASQTLNSAIPASWPQQHNIDCAAMGGDDTETPPHIGSSKGNIASYLREYPQIFMKKQGNGLSQTELTFATLKTGQSHIETYEGTKSKNKVKQTSPSSTSYEEISLVCVEKVHSKKKITISDSNTSLEDKTVKLTMHSELQTKRTATAEEKKIKSKLKKQRASESEKYASEVMNKVLDDLQESNTSEGDYKKASAESKHSNNNKNKDSKETLNNDNIKKNTITHFAISNAGNSKNIAEYQTPGENNDDEFSFGKNETVEEYLIQSNTDISKNASDITILNETTKEESVLSQILTVANNEQFMPSGITNVFKSKDNKISIRASDESILIENNNREFTHSNLFNVDNNKKLKAGNSSEIVKVDNNKDFIHTRISNGNKIKEPTGVKISKEDSNSNLNNNIKEINSDVLNLSNNKEFSQKNTKETELTESQISKNDKNKELPLRMLPNDDNITDSLGVQVSTKYSSDIKISRELKNKEPADEKILKEVVRKVPQISNGNKIKEPVGVKISNKISCNKIKEPIDIKISKEDINSNLNDTGKEMNTVLLNLSNNKECPEKNTKETELTDSEIFKNDKNKELALRMLTNDDNITGLLGVQVSSKDSSDIKISREVKNTESTDDKILKELVSKVPQISNSNKIKEPIDVKISKEDISSNLNNTSKEMNTDLLNLSNNKEFSEKNTKETELTDSEIFKNDKNKELALRMLTNDDNITDLLGVQVSNKDSSDIKISGEVKNKGSTDDKIPKEVVSKVPTVHCHCRKYK